jgi:dihydropyrimidinase
LSSTLVAGGRIVDADGETAGAVRFFNGVITGVGDLEPEPGERVVDAAGCLVLPGLIDIHVHLDDVVGGVAIADGFGGGSEAAMLGGITTIGSFVTQRPGEDIEAAVSRMASKVEGASRCDAVLHLTPTAEPWDWQAVERLADRGLRTIKLYTTYREAGLFSSYERIEEVMSRLAALGLGLLVHCEDEGELAAAASADVDPHDPRNHGILRPEAAETAAIDRLCELASRTRCPTHVVHVSTPAGAASVAGARAGGAPISCETGPQYLLLDSTALAPPHGHRSLCTPPFRAPETRAGLETALLDGSFDLLATDHCPFLRADKDSSRDFREVPNGLPGVGALLALAWELLVVKHRRPVMELVERLAAGPARVMGLTPAKGGIRVGADADLLVLDPAGPGRPVMPTLSDSYSPWQGRTTRLALRRVYLRGTEVVRDGELTGEPPSGRLLGPS